MMVISFALPLHFPETDLRITPPSGLIAFAASLLLGLLLSPDAVQAEYKALFGGLVSSENSAPLIPLFSVKGRPVSWPCAWNAGPREESSHLSNSISCNALFCRVLIIVVLKQSFLAADMHCMVGM